MSMLGLWTVTLEWEGPAGPMNLRQALTLRGSSVTLAQVRSSGDASADPVVESLHETAVVAISPVVKWILCGRCS